MINSPIGEEHRQFDWQNSIPQWMNSAFATRVANKNALQFYNMVAKSVLFERT
jgi:hypothetical protein